MNVVVAHSDDPDTEEALAEILVQCREKLQGGVPVAGILYACIDAEHGRLVSAFQQEFPGLRLIGCTTDGELSSVMSFQEDSIVLMLFHGDDVRCTGGVARELGEGVTESIGQALKEATPDFTPQLCIAFPEGLLISGVSVVDGFNEHLPKGVPLVGGTAGDQWNLKSTYQFFDGELLQNSAPFLLLGGVRVGVGVSSGWLPLGQPVEVTEAKGNVVKSIGGSPAVDFFREHFGDSNALTPEHPLGVLSTAQDDASLYLRAPLGVTDTGGIIFAGDIPQGAKVHATSASRDDVLSACQTSLDNARTSFGEGAPAAALVISCAARKALLGTQTVREYELLREKVGEIPVIGFYSYGEIAPLHDSNVASFHNETFVTVLLGTA